MPNPAIRRHRTYAQSPGFLTPADLASLEWWYEADAGNLFTDTSRTTPAGDGDQAAGITDQSSNANHAAHATVHPIVRFNMQGGKPGLEFNGSTHLMRATTGATLNYSTDGWYIAFWGQIDEVPSTTPVYGSTASANPIIRLNNTTGNDYRGDAVTYQAFTNTATLYEYEPAFWEFIADSSGNYEIRRNGTNYQNGSPTLTDTAITIVDFAARGTERGAWRISSLVVCNAEPTDAFKTSLFNYYKAKYRPYNETIIALSPYIYYPMDEGLSTAVLNHGTGGWNGTYTASDIAGATEFLDSDQAPLFVTADSDCINWYNASLESAIDWAEVTISMWAQYPADAVWADGSSRYLFYYEPNSDSQHWLNVHKLSTSTASVHNLKFSTTRAGTLSEQTVDIASLGLAPGEWFNLIVTVSETGDAFRCYINGSQIGTDVTGLGTWAATLNDTTQTAIMAQSSAGASSFPGGARHFALWGSVLSTADITTVSTEPTYATLDFAPYGTKVQAFSPQIYWRMNDAAGTVAANVGTLSAADGTYSAADIAGQTTGPDGRTVAPLFVNADNDYMDPYTTALNGVFNMENSSLSFWFRFDGDYGTDTGQYLMGFGPDTSNTLIVQVSAADTLQFRYRQGAANQDIDVTVTTAGIDDTNWHHAVWIINTTGSASSLYIDGSLAGTASATAWASNGVATTDALAAADDTPAGTGWGGSIADFAWIQEILLPDDALNLSIYSATEPTDLEAYSARVAAYSPTIFIKANEALGETAVINYGSLGTGANWTHSDNGEAAAGTWADGVTPAAGYTNGGAAETDVDSTTWGTVFDPTDKSYSFWWKYDGDWNATNGEHVFRVYASGSNYIRFFIPTDNQLRFQFAGHGGVAAISVNVSTEGFDDSEWHHTLAVCDVTGGTTSLYIDGRLVGTDTSPTSWAGGSGINGPNSGFGLRDIGTPGTAWEGSLAMFAEIPAVLTAHDAYVLSIPGVPTAEKRYQKLVLDHAPVLYWKFDEASGTTAFDHGSAGGNVTYSASDIAGQTTGPFGGLAARMIAADSDYIDLGTGGTVESNWPANELTISGWVRGYDGAWADTVQNFSLSINSASETLWLQNVNIPNTLSYRYQVAPTTKQSTAVLSPVPGTTWHHIMLTISLSNDRLFLYFDNEQILTTTGLPTWTGAAWSLARLGSNGAAYGNFDYAHWAVFDRELGAGARAALYNGGPV